MGGLNIRLNIVKERINDLEDIWINDFKYSL